MDYSLVNNPAPIKAFMRKIDFTSREQTGWLEVLIFACGVGVLAAFILPFVANSPIWDDSTILRGFAQKGASGAWIPLFGDYLRPLAMLSLWVPWELGLPQRWNTSLSVLIFSCCAALCASSAAKMRDLAGVSMPAKAPLFVSGAFLATAVYFALNPVFGEAQEWFSGRFDALLALAACAHARLCLGNRRSLASRTAWVFGVSLAAGMCKESAVLLAPFWAVFAIGAARAMEPGRLPRRGTTLAAATLAGVAVWFSIRAWALPEALPSGRRAANSAFEATGWMLEAFARYQALAFGSPLERLPLTGGEPLGTWWLGAAGALGIVAAGALCAWGWRRRSAWALMAGLALAQAGAFAPLAALLDISAEGFVAPRNMVPPLAWGAAALAPAWLWLRARSGSRVAWSACAAVMLCCAVQAIPARAAWRSNLDLWLGSPGAASGARVATIQLGYALLEAGRDEQAMRLATTYLNRHPERSLLHCHVRAALALSLAKQSYAPEQAVVGYEELAYCSEMLSLLAAEGLLRAGRCEEARKLVDLSIRGPHGSSGDSFHGLWTPRPEKLLALRAIREKSVGSCPSLPTKD